jgi:glutamate N-acetyltransferase/amino-acid N-acetyltransferase
MELKIMSERLPQGFKAAGVYSGVKSDPKKLDLALIVSDRPAAAAGVFTQNLVVAAPVKLCQARTPSASIRAVVANSGCANACTGAQGEKDAATMAAKVAQLCGLDEKEVLVMSTGVIGEMLPLEKISAGIVDASRQLASDQASLLNAARGILTTDTVHKVKTREIELDGVPICVTGIAKGAAMIGPNLATMLAVVLTDAKLRIADVDAGLKDAADESFNCISVDGHTSTNDTVLLLANGAAGSPELSGSSLSKFQATLVEVCEDLAQSIPADGEGASHLITVEVHGSRTRKEAVQVAKTIADSPLVKTAIAGCDPNWGRIVSAAGYSGVPFDPAKVSLLINGILLYEHGSPVKFDPDVVSDSMKHDRNTSVVLLLEEGDQSARFWTTDLTAEYVRLNADYHT